MLTMRAPPHRTGMFRGVVAGSEARGGQQDAQHLRVALRRPQREDIEAAGDKQAGQERVEEVERRRAHQQREEEQPAIDAADGERTMKRLVDGPVRRAVVHDPTSKKTASIRADSEQPGEELAGEQRESAAEHDAGDLPLRAAFAEHEHQSADDDGDERERARERSGERERRGCSPRAPTETARTRWWGEGGASRA